MADPASVTIQRRLLWSECDPTNRWHFSSVLSFIEEAETLMHHRLGIAHETFPRLPRLNITVDFLAPMHFSEVADVTIAVEQIRHSSLRYAFTVCRAQRTLARGTMTVAWLNAQTGRAAPWPDHLRKVLLGSGPLTDERD